jgi:hypothetical protein
VFITDQHGDVNVLELRHRQPRLARRAGTLQPHPPDPKRFQRVVVGGGAEPAVADHRPRAAGR